MNQRPRNHQEVGHYTPLDLATFAEVLGYYPDKQSESGSVYCREALTLKEQDGQLCFEQAGRLGAFRQGSSLGCLAPLAHGERPEGQSSEHQGQEGRCITTRNPMMRDESSR
jgi:hypothetical protein